MSDRLVILGPGRMGLALGYALWQAEAVETLAYMGRRPEPPSHPLFMHSSADYVHGLVRPSHGTTALFLAVPDDRISEMAHAIAELGAAPEGCSAFHLSGVLSTEALTPLHAVGYSVGSFHPLQTVAHSITGADRLPGSSIAVAGEQLAQRTANRLVAALGCTTINVPVRTRPAYHAAAVMASNYLAGLLGASVRLLSEAGVPEKEALSAILPLARGTLDNIEEVGLARAITGPIVRGDSETVGLHMRALGESDRALYTAMGRELLRQAQEAGLLDADQIAEILALIE